MSDQDALVVEVLRVCEEERSNAHAASEDRARKELDDVQKRLTSGS